LSNFFFEHVGDSTQTNNRKAKNTTSSMTTSPFIPSSLSPFHENENEKFFDLGAKNKQIDVSRQVDSSHRVCNRSARRQDVVSSERKNGGQERKAFEKVLFHSVHGGDDRRQRRRCVGLHMSQARSDVRNAAAVEPGNL
jgi:hypothetical protein